MDKSRFRPGTLIIMTVDFLNKYLFTRNAIFKKLIKIDQYIVNASMIVQCKFV